MPIKLSDDENMQAFGYMNGWYYQKNAILAAAGIDDETHTHLIDAGYAPGIIYAYHPDHGWWSALAAYIGTDTAYPPSDSEHWYNPACIWWLRRAKLALREKSTTPEQVVDDTKAAFCADFLAQLKAIPNSHIAYPECFKSDKALNHITVKQSAEKEWQAWTSGAYAVCLKDFTAEKCIQKETMGAILKRHFSGTGPAQLNDSDIIAMCQKLDALMMPFAPWERSSCTPGLTIDQALTTLKLGKVQPYISV
jgi:hypothetical protein